MKKIICKLVGHKKWTGNFNIKLSFTPEVSPDDWQVFLNGSLLVNGKDYSIYAERHIHISKVIQCERCKKIIDQIELKGISERDKLSISKIQEYGWDQII